MLYGICFDFESEDDPPRVYIHDDAGRDVIEVLEEPTCTDISGWSWDGDDWEPGPLATRLVDFLNGDLGEAK